MIKFHINKIFTKLSSDVSIVLYDKIYKQKDTYKHMAKRGRPRKSAASDSVIDVLTHDHREVLTFFDKRDSAIGEKKRELTEKIYQSLEAHSRVEEEIFYPFVESNGDEMAREMIARSLAEHKKVKNLIEELKNLDIDEIGFEDKFSELHDSAKEHMSEEENDLFPRIQELGNEELIRVGREVISHKKALQQSLTERVAESPLS